jgi:biopolymer transport protein ExbD
MSTSADQNSSPNLTPILDMVFQLITFFMLVVTFKGVAVDASLSLPVLGSARPLDWQEDREPLMLNVNQHGDVLVGGTIVNVDDYLSQEARLQRVRRQAMGEPAEGILSLPVVIRADRNSTFEQVNHVMEACQREGFRELALSALTRTQEAP